MLSTLINQVDKNTFKIPFGWSNKIGAYYEPFVKAIWTNPDALKIILEKKGGTSRFTILYKFWALNNITTLEQARATIPLCPFCQKELCIPASAMPDKERSRGWISDSCHQKICAGKYKNSKTTQGMIRLHGVTNANDMIGMKDIKSALLKKACQERGDEIVRKREETCKNNYGVTNVSKSHDIKVKKAMTTFKNYGVYNPDYSREINISRSMKVIESTSNVINIQGKDFKILHSSEEDFLRVLINWFGVDLVDSNNYLFEKDAKCHIVDFSIANQIFIELKSCIRFHWSVTNYEYIKSRIDIVQDNLKDNQKYILYVRDNYTKYKYVLALSNSGISSIYSDQPDPEIVYGYFGYRYCQESKIFKIGLNNLEYQILNVIRRMISQK